jgi:DNA-binding CsgD family transcriptional regulator
MSISGPFVAMATNQSAAAPQSDLQCPVCGAWSSDSQCRKTPACRELSVAARKAHKQKRSASAASQQAVPDFQTAADSIQHAALDALSQLHIGLVLCSDSGEILGHNEVAESVLAAGDALMRNQNGVLCVTQEAGRSFLEIERERIQRQRQTLENGSVLAVSRGPGKRPLTVFIHTCASPVDGATSESTLLLMILDSALPLGSIEAELQDLYRLTPTEARLASRLMEGSALEDCCEALGFSRPTACTHLRRIFKKTGVHRQTELVALLLKSVGLAFLGGSHS